MTTTMRIGGLELSSRVMQAPMVGITDHITRGLAYEFGCGLAVAEMVHVSALLKKGIELLRWFPPHVPGQPTAVQLAGYEPEEMAAAAEEAFAAGAQLVDINMGCPRRTTTNCGAGAALLLDFDMARRIVKAVVGVAAGPVTVKLRAGWSRQTIAADDAAAKSQQAVEYAMMAEDCGASAVTVHARFAVDHYGITADWEIIKRVVEALKIPVIGNGDVQQPADASRMMAETGCEGIMIGRAAIGNPWIFHRVNQELKTGADPGPPTLDQRLAVILLHQLRMMAWLGEARGVRRFRVHLSGYLRGLPANDKLKGILYLTNSRLDFITALSAYLDKIPNSPRFKSTFADAILTRSRMVLHEARDQSSVIVSRE